MNGPGADLATRRRIPYRRIASHALTLLGALVALAYWLLLTSGGGSPLDLATYYHIHLDDLYAGWVVGGPDSFQYSPAFAQLIAAVRVLPFDALVAIWRAAALACLVWLAGPFTLPVLLWGPAVSEVNAGNVNIFIAAAIAWGFRRPGAWSFVLLTKITPGIGLLWFVVRRQWRSLKLVAAVTAAIALVSFAISPGQWIAWGILLLTHANDAVPTFPYYLPLGFRLPVAGLVVILGARLGWPATVAIAATLAAPVLYFPTQAILLGALPPIREAIARRLDPWLDRLPAPSLGSPVTAGGDSGDAAAGVAPASGGDPPTNRAVTSMQGD